MINAITHDIETRFKDIYEAGRLRIFSVHSQNEEEAKLLAEEIKEAFPKSGDVYIDRLSLSVSCHIGPGALAIACSITQ